MVFKEGIPESIDRPNMFKIKYEWGGKSVFVLGSHQLSEYLVKTWWMDCKN